MALRGSFLGLSPRYWLASLLATLVLLLSLGEGGGVKPEFHASIAPAAGQPGSVKLAFYGSRFDEYVGGGELRVPKTGWEIWRGADSTILTAQGAPEPVSIVATDDDPVHVSFIRHPRGG